MATPQWKVYRGKEYVASCKYADDAWILCGSFLGRSLNAIVRYNHEGWCPAGIVVWTEVSDGTPYVTADQAENIMRKRVAEEFAEA